jgi:hypothetical protein
VATRADITPEEAQGARARAWAFVFQCWHAKRGDLYDLTKDVATQAEGANQGKKGHDSNVRC